MNTTLSFHLPALPPPAHLKQAYLKLLHLYFIDFRVRNVIAIVTDHCRDAFEALVRGKLLHRLVSHRSIRYRHSVVYGNITQLVLNDRTFVIPPKVYTPPATVPVTCIIMSQL